MLSTMEIEEIFSSPFTTPTTCYSASSCCGGISRHSTIQRIRNRTRRRDVVVTTAEGGGRGRQGGSCSAADADDDDHVTTISTTTTTTIRLATENHILGVTTTTTTTTTCCDDDDDNADGEDLRCDSRGRHRRTKIHQDSVAIPKDSPHLICVGYSEWEGECEVCDETGNGHYLEALQDNGYYDDHHDSSDKQYSSPPTPQQHPHRLVQAIAMIDPTMIDDDNHSFRDDTMVVNLYHPSQQQQQQHQYPHHHHHHDYGIGGTGWGGSSTANDRDDVASIVSVADGSLAMSSVAGHSVRTIPTRNLSLTTTSGGASTATTTVSTVSTTVASSSSAASATANIAPTPSPHHQKSKSEPPMVATGSMLSSDNTGTHHQNSVIPTTMVLDGTTEVNSPSQKATTTTKDGVLDRTSRRRSKARLILQQQRSNDKDIFQHVALLDFRPLSPCVTRWGRLRLPRPQQQQRGVAGVTEDGDTVVGIWVGSADDAHLRFYVPSSSDHRHSLQSITLPEDHFSFDTPVLALDFLSVSWEDDSNGKEQGTGSSSAGANHTMHTLAAACQDGAIQLMSWTGDDLSFTNLVSTRVIVDGPLVCIRLNYCSEAALLRVVIGSLCGYVCQLKYDRKASTWEGPYMIAEGFWNPLIETEDSVTSVDIWKNYVAVGTQVGRCFLYATHNSEDYFPLWSILLPYSVHNIRLIQKSATPLDVSDDESLDMNIAVTTRRSFHIFDVVRGHVPWRIKPSGKRYSPDLARERLIKILQDVRKENEVADAKQRSLVQESMGGIMEVLDVLGGSDQEMDGISTTDASNNSLVESNSIAESVDEIDHRDTTNPNNNDIASASGENVAMDETTSVSTPKAPHLEYSSSEEDEEDATNNLQEFFAQDDGPMQEDANAEVGGVSISESTESKGQSQLDSTGGDDFVMVESEPENFDKTSDEN